MRSPVEHARRAARVTRVVLRASRASGRPPHAVLRRAFELHVRRGYALAEAQGLGLLDPGLPDVRLAEFVPRADLWRLQRRLNPSGLAALTEDKAIFHHVCALAGLPAARVYGVLYRNGDGWTAEHPSPRTRPEWGQALDSVLPEEFVAKPIDGHRGIGVRLLRRAGAGFAEGDRRYAGAEDLYDSLVPDGRDAGVLLQERLHSHALLVRSSGSSTLQTARVITLLDADEEVSVLAAVLKIVTGNASVDNFRNAAAGNGYAAVELADGALSPLVVPGPGGLGWRELDCHPRTGERIAGLRLPDWDAALDLARRAAQVFAPIRTVGWDVALTPDGPMLVEGNMWWGPPNEVGLMPSIMRALSENAAQPPTRASLKGASSQRQGEGSPPAGQRKAAMNG